MILPGRDRKLLIAAATLILVHVLRILVQKLRHAVLDNETELHPFLRTFIKSCSMTVFLVKLAADASWTRIFPENGTSGWTANAAAVAYSSLNQDEDSGATPDEDEDHVFEQSDWVPIRHDGSDDGSDRSTTGSLGSEVDVTTVPVAKKRSKVRFSKFSEVRTMDSSDANAAFFARLSYQASLKAEADAAKAENRLPPLQTTRMALKLSFIYFTAHFMELNVISESSELAGPVIAGVACLTSLVVLVILFNHMVDSDRLRPSQAIVCIMSLASAALTTMCLTSLESVAPMDRLAAIRSHAIQIILSGTLHAAFVLCLRREVGEADRMDIMLFTGMTLYLITLSDMPDSRFFPPLLTGLMAFFQVTLSWPGFFFVDVRQSSSDSWLNVSVVLLGDIMFTSMIELLWIW
jgi:hypothetical protein